MALRKGSGALFFFDTRPAGRTRRPKNNPAARKSSGRVSRAFQRSDADQPICMWLWMYSATALKDSLSAASSI